MIRHPGHPVLLELSARLPRPNGTDPSTFGGDLIANLIRQLECEFGCGELQFGRMIEQLNFSLGLGKISAIWRLIPDDAASKMALYF